ncbi:MAG: glycosyltransferase [Nanoarchaeota archaeon]
MKEKIIFSFIIPAHNEEDVIDKCLNSIKEQEFQNKFETIVINDGSTDKTKNIVENFSDTKLLNLNKGHSAAFARNRGAEIAKGKYLIFLDADQIIEKDFVIKFLDLIKEEVDGTRFWIRPYRPITIFQKSWAAYRKVNLCGALIIRKKIFEKLKYDENLFYVEDDDIFDRFTESGYRLKKSNLFADHIDPKTFDDFFRQRKWQGKGLALKIFKLKKFRCFRYFIPCTILPLMFIGWYIPFLYLLIFWAYFSLKSKQLINSFLWATLDTLGRFIALYYFVTNSLNLKKC